MFLSQVLRALAQAWLVVLIGVLVTAGAVYAALQTVAPTHVSSSRLLFLLPPDATGRETPTNPFLNLTGGLTATAIIVAEIGNSGPTAQELKDSGFEAEYSVSLTPGAAAPILVIVAEDEDPAMVSLTIAEVQARLTTLLADIQSDADAPSQQTISATLLDGPTVPEVRRGDQLRAAGGALALGGVCTLVAAFVFQRVRSRGRGAGPDGGASADGAPAAAHTHDSALAAGSITSDELSRRLRAGGGVRRARRVVAGPGRSAE